MFAIWLGMLIIFIGLLPLYLSNKSDEDDLPIPKEQIYKSSLLIITLGLLIYESGKISKRLIDYYTERPPLILK